MSAPAGRKKPDNAEEREQIYLFDFMRHAHFRHSDGSLRPVVKYLFAIPNGGHRHPVTAAKMKAAGVKPGVSDLFLAYPHQDKHGLWIELKVGKGKPSRDQLAWIDSMVEVDYLAMVVWGWKSVVDSVDAYLGGLYTAAGVRLKLDMGRAVC